MANDITIMVINGVNYYHYQNKQNVEYRRKEIKEKRKKKKESVFCILSDVTSTCVGSVK
jgi:hypothetical protein